VWNNFASTESGALLAVTGYTDEELFAKTGEETKERLIEFVGVSSEDVVLEIGAGVGRVGNALAPLCKEWIGADVSENMLSHLRRRLGQSGNVRTVVLNGYDLSPIPSCSIDLVYCTVVFMHLEEWERFGYIREGMRVLKPGGRMLVDNINLLSNSGWKFFLDHMEQYPPSMRPPNISKASTPQELETYFRRAGFENIQQRTIDLWLITYGLRPVA
jgi:ubiquinone/menaquinone biosynthesis C-methylase UbiE